MNNIDNSILKNIELMNEQEVRDLLFELFSNIAHVGIGGKSESDQFKQLRSIYKQKIVSPQKKEIEEGIK
ncbi:hypothetical protein [Heyndrickxia acidicola]|uniref:hypothetical protein n=1 Tax=Heyndrickxia acidicola TaxID=209389 RepID=UPI0008264D6E|nr:hypothetical protein [Heyndrickxia acidicola]